MLGILSGRPGGLFLFAALYFLPSDIETTYHVHGLSNRLVEFRAFFVASVILPTFIKVFFCSLSVVINKTDNTPSLRNPTPSRDFVFVFRRVFLFLNCRQFHFVRR